MELRNMTIYSIFVRNHGGNFAAVEKDIPRIRALGADAVWLLPIHPIGQKERKGALGSPYAIADYRAVNPEYGTMEDFRHLADAVHQNGMKLMIDVVYNHTSPDSWLAQHHPEWFYHKPDGSFGNRIGEWSDIIDLDYGNPGLWDYQIETLKSWAEIVDGFRCDVAPLVPLEFWLRARREVETVRPDCLWLAESVEPEFIRDNRNRGMVSHSDCELYQAFDLCYDYDIYGDFLSYVQGKAELTDYVRALERQESIYPADYAKLRFLENHDRPRMAHLFPERRTRLNWLCWMFFQKGTALLYSGQEWENDHRPDLFDADPIPMEGPAPLEGLIRRLTALKKDPLFEIGAYSLRACPGDVLTAVWQERRENGKRLTGCFCLRGNPALVPVELSDGRYENLLKPGTFLRVESGLLSLDGNPAVLQS